MTRGGLVTVQAEASYFVRSLPLSYGLPAVPEGSIVGLLVLDWWDHSDRPVEPAVDQSDAPVD